MIVLSSEENLIFWSFGPEVLDIIVAVVGGATALKVTTGARVPIPVLLVNFNLNSESLEFSRVGFNLYSLSKIYRKERKMY